VAGIAMLISYVVPGLSLALLIVVLNLPIFVLGWIFIDRRFTLWSMLGMGSLALFLELTKPWVPDKAVCDLYLGLIAGGLLSGVGVGLTFRARGSMGGTDIIAAILRKRYSVSIGGAQFFLNALIVAALGVRFTLQSALASAFSIFFEAWSTDQTILGLNTNKTLLIVTDRPREVGQALMDQLGRGVTYLKGESGLRPGDRMIVYCVIAPRQLSQAKALLEAVDPESFSTVMDTVEVLGKGFRRLPI